MKCKLTGWPWAKQLAEQSAIHMVENGLWPLTSEQDNKRQVAEMTKRWSPVTKRRHFRRHGCPCKCPRWWGTHSSMPWERWLPCRSLARFIWAVPISWLPISTLTRFGLSYSNRLVITNQNAHALFVRIPYVLQQNLPKIPRSVVGQKEKSVYVTTNTCPLTSRRNQCQNWFSKIHDRDTMDHRAIANPTEALTTGHAAATERASEMDCCRVRLCHIINPVQSDKRVRSSQSNFIKVRHMTEKSQHRVPHVVLIIFTRTTK